MATERLAPDGATFTLTALTGAYTDVDDDPDSPDANWLTASDNNVNTAVEASFPTPTGNPTVGTDLQEFRVLFRQFDEAQGGTPEGRIELWENGALVRAGSDTAIPDGGLVVSFTWNANELSTADGSLVECNAVGTKSGGAPGNRNSIEVGAIEWNVEYDVGGVTHYGAATLSGVGTLASIAQNFCQALVTLSGVGSLAGAGRLTAIGKATLSGVGALTGSAVKTLTGVATLIGVGTVDAIGTVVSGVTHLGAATLSGLGNLAAIAQNLCQATTTLTGFGSVIAKGVTTLIGKTTLSGVGSVTGSAAATFVGKATLIGQGGLVALGGLIQTALSTFSGIGSLVAFGGLIKVAKATFSGIGSLVANGLLSIFIKLTLKIRNFILNLNTRPTELTLQSRNFSLTLKER